MLSTYLTLGILACFRGWRLWGLAPVVLGLGSLFYGRAPMLVSPEWRQILEMPMAITRLACLAALLLMVVIGRGRRGCRAVSARAG
jgi:hypothetical protein